jgi:hypothetical protein
VSYFIVNPPIKSNRNYYRQDDELITRFVTGRTSLLITGLRRSGKTSFLLKIRRVAEDDFGKQVVYHDLRDFSTGDESAELCARIVESIRSAGDAVVLLDEAEAPGREALETILRSCRRHIVALTCSPLFTQDLSRQSVFVQDYLEELQQHILGGLTAPEARALLSLEKRPEAQGVSSEDIEKIVKSGERLPLILQAKGRELVDHVPIAGTLALAAPRILLGLPQRHQRILTTVATGGRADAEDDAVTLLCALGALEVVDEGGEARVRAAGPVFSGLIRKAATQITQPSPEEWSHYATILHLSDLHFGAHCLESPLFGPGQQLERLIYALERDGTIPDFVAITGDISWSARSSEYELAEQFIGLLTDWLGQRRKWSSQEALARTLIIPGNHDTAWCLTRGLKTEEEEIWACHGGSPYASFINRLYQDNHGIYWNLEKPFQKRCFCDPSLAFVLVSTVRDSTERERQGRFGRIVRQGAVAILRQEDVRTASFRIGLFHHNLAHHFEDTGVIRDAPKVLNHLALCEPGLDIALHGHTHHRGNVGTVTPPEDRKPFSYSAVGSFGVGPEHRQGVDAVGRVPNEFAIVDLETSGKRRAFSTRYYTLEIKPTKELEWQARAGTVDRKILD